MKELVGFMSGSIVLTYVYTKVIPSLIIVVVALVALKLIDIAIRKIFSGNNANKRTSTLMVLLKNIANYVVWFFVAISLLEKLFNIDATSILAAAGIVGVAVGFGAQGLVKDVITGFFILFENHFSVGDTVTIEGFKGTVEVLGLRSTKIRNEEGDLFIIPNSSITKIINHSKSNIEINV